MHAWKHVYAFQLHLPIYWSLLPFQDKMKRLMTSQKTALYNYASVACIYSFSMYMHIFQPASWTILLQSLMSLFNIQHRSTVNSGKSRENKCFCIGNATMSLKKESSNSFLLVSVGRESSFLWLYCLVIRTKMRPWFPS